MLIQVIEGEPVLLKFIADKYKTQELCEKAVEVKGWALRYVPDQYNKNIKNMKKNMYESHSGRPMVSDIPS